MPPQSVDQSGEVVGTNLENYAMPLIRYRTRDLTRMIATPCSCGNVLPMHDRILGRTDDMIIFRAVNIYPGQIDEALSEIPDIGSEYQVILDAGDDGKDYMTMRVEIGKDQDLNNRSEIATRVKDAIKSRIMVSCEVDLVEYAGLPRSERKSKRIYDNRNR